MNIYRELIAFQEGVLARDGHDGADGHNGKGANGSTVHPLSLDAAALNAQLEKHRRRLEFWYDRHWELQGLAVDSASLVATHRDRQVHLTRREFQLLSFLLSYPGQTFTASVLAQRAWSDAHLSNDQVRIYVARLRTRLSDLGLPCRLVSHPRRGYSIACD
jgi:DNA-binding response OmpR family regulator